MTSDILLFFMSSKELSHSSQTTGPLTATHFSKHGRAEQSRRVGAPVASSGPRAPSHALMLLLWLQIKKQSESGSGCKVEQHSDRVGELLRIVEVGKK